MRSRVGDLVDVYIVVACQSRLTSSDRVTSDEQACFMARFCVLIDQASAQSEGIMNILNVVLWKNILSRQFHAARRRRREARSMACSSLSLFFLSHVGKKGFFSMVPN